MQASAPTAPPTHPPPAPAPPQKLQELLDASALRVEAGAPVMRVSLRRRDYSEAAASGSRASMEAVRE
jgi:hypothetical protein